MADEKPVFTSDKRSPRSTSWADDGDWVAGSLSNLDVVDGGLVPSEVSSGGILLDGFERGSLSDEYGGNTESGAVQSDIVHVDDYALELRGNKYDTISRTDVVVERGGVYSGWVRNTRNYSKTVYQREAGIVFMTQEASSTPGGYYVEIRQDDGKVTVYKPKTGESVTTTIVKSVSFPSSMDTWYKTEFEPKDDGTEEYRIYDASGDQLLSFSTSEGAYSSGGIGFAHGGDSDQHIAHFDDVRRWS